MCSTFRDQKMLSASPRAGVTGSCNWVVRTKLRTSAGAVYTLNHRAIFATLEAF